MLRSFHFKSCTSVQFRWTQRLFFCSLFSFPSPRPEAAGQLSPVSFLSRRASPSPPAPSFPGSGSMDLIFCLICKGWVDSCLTASKIHYLTGSPVITWSGPARLLTSQKTILFSALKDASQTAAMWRPLHRFKNATPSKPAHSLAAALSCQIRASECKS